MIQWIYIELPDGGGSGEEFWQIMRLNQMAQYMELDQDQL